MKYKNQPFLYIFIFIVGYCTNFLLPVNFFVAATAQIENVENESKTLNKNAEPDKSTYINITSDNNKFVEIKPQNAAPKNIKPSIIASESHSSDSSEDLATLQNELARLREYRMQTEINKRNEYMQAHGGNSVEALNDNFKHEPIDASWAKEKQSLINDIVDQSDHLSRIPHMASECRSKQCKLSVLSDDEFYLKDLPSSLGKVIADHESSFSSYTTIIDERSHTTSIYFDRN